MGILPYLVALIWISGCGEDSKTLTVQYTKGGYNLQLIAIVSVGPDAASYAANLTALPVAGGSRLEFYGRETTAAGAIVDTYVEKIKQCAVYESRVSGTPNLDPMGFVAGNVSDPSGCTSTAGSYFARGFGSGNSYEDALSSGSYKLVDSSDGYVLAMFFNNNSGPATGSVTIPLRRCFQICARKVQNKQFYSASSQSLSDVLNCDLSALNCYDF
jgi:hypothetical protein